MSDEHSLVHVVVPGALDQRTGGYLYDAHMVRGLRAQGRRVEVHELEGDFPEAAPEHAAAFAARLAALSAGATVVIDGLAGGALPEVLAPQRDRLRLVALVHHPLADEAGLDGETQARLFAAEREGLAMVRGVIVTSRFMAERLADFGVAPERVRVVEPGTERVAPAGHAGPRADAAPGAPVDSPPVLLSVGTVTPRKAHDILIEALARIADLRWRCVIAGSLERDPVHAARVQARAAELGLEGRIDFTGELDDAGLEAHWQTASLFVLPSRYEGYGMAFTEALARGLPVVATRAGAIPFTVPAAAGRLVAPDDVEALAQAIAELVDDTDLRARLSAAALAHAGTLPDWTTQVRRFAAAVDELAAHG